jgi:hypothetical protein
MTAALRWPAKVRAISLDHLYMVDHLPDPVDLPPHLLWQAPFVLASPDEPFERLVERVAVAGALWLTNHDLRPHQELVIVHVERPWFMAFQRELRPDELHLVIGPLPVRVLRPSEGQPLWELPLRFREAEVGTSRELWRQIDARARK